MYAYKERSQEKRQMLEGVFHLINKIKMKKVLDETRTIMKKEKEVEGLYKIIKGQKDEKL